MIGPRNVRPDELGDAQEMDVDDALRVASRLLDSVDDQPVTTSEGFTDDVMAALATEPTPGTTGFLVPLRRLGPLAGFRESIRQARASIGSGRPILGRTAALAYVLAVAIAGLSLTGAATLGAAGALGLLGATPTQSPVPLTPAPTEPPASDPPATIAPPPSAVEPTEAATPSPKETEDESEGPDDDGDNSGPGGGDERNEDDSGGEGDGADDDSEESSGPDGSGGDDSESGSPESDD